MGAQAAAQPRADQVAVLRKLTGAATSHRVFENTRPRARDDIYWRARRDLNPGFPASQAYAAGSFSVLILTRLRAQLQVEVLVQTRRTSYNHCQLKELTRNHSWPEARQPLKKQEQTEHYGQTKLKDSIKAPIRRARYSET